MKKLIVIAALAAGLYYGYQQGHFESILENETIENPVFLRMNIEIEEQGRRIEGVLIGKMRSHAECESQEDNALRNLWNECPVCRLKSAICSDTIPVREARYFDKVPTHLTYLHLEPDNSTEREGSVIFWGLTVQEARLACQAAKQDIARRYSGELTCVEEHEI